MRRSAGLPEGIDDRICRLWDAQPNGMSTIEFVLAVSDATSVPLIDPVTDDAE